MQMAIILVENIKIILNLDMEFIIIMMVIKYKQIGLMMNIVMAKLSIMMAQYKKDVFIKEKLSKLKIISI